MLYQLLKVATAVYTPFDWSRGYEWKTWPQVTRSATDSARASLRYAEEEEEYQSIFEDLRRLHRANEARVTVSPADREMLLDYLQSTIYNTELPQATFASPALEPVSPKPMGVFEYGWPRQMGDRTLDPKEDPPVPGTRPPMNKQFFDWGWLKQSEDGGWEGGPYEFPEYLDDIVD